MEAIAVALVILALAVIVQRLVTVIKTAAAGGFKPLAWMALSAFLGVAGAWLLTRAGVSINLFEAFGAKPTLEVALTTGLIAGLLGPDIYNVTQWIREARQNATAPQRR